MSRCECVMESHSTKKIQTGREIGLFYYQFS
nr:MAG TPA: hypothetical protein [Caudoviricetes sp.]